VRLEVALAQGHGRRGGRVERGNQDAGGAEPGASDVWYLRRSAIGPAAALPANSPLLEGSSGGRQAHGSADGPEARFNRCESSNVARCSGVVDGAGGEGRLRAHAGEWYSAKDRDLGLRRVMLLTLAMAAWAAEQ